MAELFTVFVSLSIFAMTWYAYNKSKNNHALFLGATFLIIGILDFFHTFSYPFMPDFITPNSPEKAAHFWYMARLVSAPLFLLSVFIYKDTLPRLIDRPVLFAFAIILIVFLSGLVLFYPEYLPVIHIEGGTTAARMFALPITSLVVLYASYLYTKRIQATGEMNYICLTYGFIILILSDIIYFTYEIPAHLIKVAAFYFIFVSLYKSSVEVPYEKLAIAEEKLHMAAEERYKNLFDKANDAIITADIDDRVTSWNKSAEKIFGFYAQEVMGKKLSELIVPPELLDKRKQLVNEALAGKGISGIETQRLRKDGTKIDVSLTISPLINAHGYIIGLSGIIRDISERKKAEDEIRKRNRYLSVLYTIDRAAAKSLDTGEVLESALTAALETLGVESGGIFLLEPDGETLTFRVHKGLSDEFVKNVQRIRLGEGISGKACALGKTVVLDVSEYPTERLAPFIINEGLQTMASAPLISGGSLIGAINVATRRPRAFPLDEQELLGTIGMQLGSSVQNALLYEKVQYELVERKKSEERYRTTLDSMLEGCQIIGYDWKYLYVNEAVAVQGRKVKEELLGRTMMKVYPGIENTEMFAELKRCMVERVSHRMENEFTFPDGSKGWFELSIEPVPEGIFILSLDITEHRKAEELRIDKERLEYASKAKTEFLASMSHELRSPLNAILGFSELLKQKKYGELNEKQKHYIENIMAGGQHLLNLINDILDLSKIEVGKVELIIDKISLPAVIDETVVLVKERATRRKIILKKEFDAQLDFIEADKQRVKQVLFNLLDNAIKFSMEEGGTVTVVTKKVNGEAQISVQDTGIGIKPEKIGKLFQKFEQLDSEVARKYGGTGLGLAISKQLVELHGGRIWAESKFSEGSTFTFTLPLRAKKEEK